VLSLTPLRKDAESSTPDLTPHEYVKVPEGLVVHSALRLRSSIGS
jgi:hypothetical protein